MRSAVADSEAAPRPRTDQRPVPALPQPPLSLAGDTGSAAAAPSRQFVPHIGTKCRFGSMSPEVGLPQATAEAMTSPMRRLRVACKERHDLLAHPRPADL